MIRVSRLQKAALRSSGRRRFHACASEFLSLARQANSHPFNEIKTKGIKILNHSKLLRLGIEVEECLGQFSHEVYLADGQVEIDFFLALSMVYT